MTLSNPRGKSTRRAVAPEGRLPRPDGPGFTLIELLVVIAIIALLVTILVPSLQEAQHLARRAVCSVNIRNLHLCMAAYVNEFDTLPPASREMSYQAFGAQYQILGFGLLTWYGYCEERGLCACTDTNYLPGSDEKLPSGGFDEPGWTWGFFRQPNTFPKYGVEGFLYGDEYDSGNSRYKGYGNVSSYAYRRASIQWQYFNRSGIYISDDRRTLSDRDFPNAYIACAQQWGGQGFGRCTANYTHQRRGSNVLFSDGHVSWLDLTVDRTINGMRNPPENYGCPENYLPYCYPFDAAYYQPSSMFWGVAERMQ